MFQMKQKIVETKRALRKWNGEVFRHVQTKIKNLTQALEEAQQAEPTVSNLEQEAQLAMELNENLKPEELLWRQKSRAIWLTSTDLNTCFFHLSTIVNSSHNAIESLKMDEGWSSDLQIIIEEERKGHLDGVKIGHSCLVFTHLLFADSLFVSAKATEPNLNIVSRVINSYELWSGQHVNKQESAIFFSRNMPNAARNTECRLPGLRKGVRKSKYLGLPLHIERASMCTFAHAIDRVTSRLDSWKLKTLSQAGRGVLIRVVASAIPSYHISTFILPKSICSKLDPLFSNIWWGVKDDGQPKIRLGHGTAYAFFKSIAGLGFRKMAEQNEALVSKQAWSVVQNYQKPHISLLKARYPKHKPFLAHKPPAKASNFWKRLCKTHCYMVGEGTSINIWTDPRVPNNPQSKALP